MLKKEIFFRNIKFFLLIFIIVLTFFVFREVRAGSTDNVSGWAWSENIEWISFNSTNCDSDGDGFSDGTPVGCPSVGTPIPNYGVDVDASNGIFSGYAWSENIGWISFNEADLVGCPVSPCTTTLSFSTNEISGWAKALDIDNWIRLRDTSYGVFWNSGSQEMEGWAWSDGLIGWMSFNCNNPELEEPRCSSDYKVITDIDATPPVVNDFDISPVYPNWVNSSVVFNVSWTVSDLGGSHLSHVEIWRASYNDTDCSDTNKDGCAWSKVDENYYAPGGLDFWTSSTSDSSLEEGVWWYGLHVLDNDNNESIEPNPPGSIKARIDTTMPNSQIKVPPSDPASPPSGSWLSSDFNIYTLDEDLGSDSSGINADQCEYKVLAYEDTDGDGVGNPPEAFSSGWQPRTSCSGSEIISVGEEPDYCRYQAREACFVYIRSQDNAGNWHIPTLDRGSITKYNIDWTIPVVGEISPLTAVQGVGQTFTASLSDLSSVSCWLYKDGEPQANSVSVSSTTVEVNYVFTEFGTFSMKFRCIDAAGNDGSGTEVSVVVTESHVPSVTILNYYPCHSSTPEQKCADQFACCTELTTQTDCDVKFNISAFDPDGDDLSYKWDFGDGNILWQESPSHHYNVANTYTSTVYVSDGITTTTDSIDVTVTNPTLSVGFTADPAFGTDSLSEVDLRSIVGGSMFGTINYKFDCTNDASWELEIFDQSVDDYTAVDVCDYLTPASYTAKTLIQRGSGSVEDTTIIDVVASECIPGQETNCTSPQGCSHTITCQANSTWPSCPTDECVQSSVRSCDNCGEQVCSLTCQWGSCMGAGECSPGPSCPDCLCPPDSCVGQDYYNYPNFGECEIDCSCDVGVEAGEACEPNIVIDDPLCNEAPVCDSLSAVPDQGVAPLSILFTGSAHDNDGAVSQYGFIFGDGGSSTSSENTVNYDYNTPGTYCAKLKVQDNDGAWSSLPGDCPDVCAKQINVGENASPVADVSCNASACGVGSACNGSWIAYNRHCEFYFLNDSTDANSANPPDNNNDIIKSTWSIFYEGGTPWWDPWIVCTDNSETPENEGICDLLMPGLPGEESYYITLTVEDAGGATNSYSKNFYVRMEAIADFECSLDPDEGWRSCTGFVASEEEAVYFKDTSTSSESSGEINTWNWLFKNGTPSTTDLQYPSASFMNVDGSSGTVTIDIVDAIGRTDTKQYQLQITIPLPEWEEVIPF